MIIEKTKRKGAICRRCNYPINSKYRAKRYKDFYHLSCARRIISIRFKVLKKELKELNKPKYKKVMILEELR